MDLLQIYANFVIAVYDCHGFICYSVWVQVVLRYVDENRHPSDPIGSKGGIIASFRHCIIQHLHNSSGNRLFHKHMCDWEVLFGLEMGWNFLVK